MGGPTQSGVCAISVRMNVRAVSTVRSIRRISSAVFGSSRSKIPSSCPRTSIRLRHSSQDRLSIRLGARPSIGVGRVASAVGLAARRADEAMPQRSVEEAQRGRWPHAAATRRARGGCGRRPRRTSSPMRCGIDSSVLLVCGSQDPRARPTRILGRTPSSQSTIDAGRDLEPADEQRGTTVLEAGQHDFEKQCRCVARVEYVAHACEFPGERLIETPDTLGSRPD